MVLINNAKPLSGTDVLAMTDAEVRIEMARFAGINIEPYSPNFKTSKQFLLITDKNPKIKNGRETALIGTFEDLPDFTHDINLIYPFEATAITDEKSKNDYCWCMNWILNRKYEVAEDMRWHFIHATPDERCRAFLFMRLGMRAKRGNYDKEDS